MFKILAYPPTTSQLNLLEMVGLRGELSLTILRCLTVVVLGAAVLMWMKLNKNNSKWVAILLIISPALWIIGLSYPLAAVELWLIVGIMFVLKEKLWLATGLTILFVIGWNMMVLGYKPAILNKLSLKDAQTEVTNRFSSEDSLKIKMEVPLWWRRVAYNKYFFSYKEVVAEVLPFFDLESIFFQEVHPQRQKSVVMFYWPEIFLFIVGIYFFNKRQNLKIFLSTFLIAVVYYVFSEGSVFLRMFVVMLPIGMVLTEGVEAIFKIKCIKYGVIAVLIYSSGLNFYDLNIRTDYWLDNRPLAYQFWYEGMAKIDLTQYDKVQITTLIGNSKPYCRYYLGDVCDDKKFVFDSFDLSTNSNIEKGVYAGFAGEFVGPRFGNDIESNWAKKSQEAGLTVERTTELRDTIAYKYGNGIGLMIKNNEK